MLRLSSLSNNLVSLERMNNRACALKPNQLLDSDDAIHTLLILHVLQYVIIWQLS